jgi:hypothetical protein
MTDGSDSRTRRDPELRLTPQEKLDRLERIRQTSSMRHFADFDPAVEARGEDIEIETNPDGLLAREANLDAGTRRIAEAAAERMHRERGQKT